MMRGTEAGRAGNREGGRAGSREQGGSEGRDPSWFDQPSTRPSPSPAEVRPQNLERESHGVRERAFRRRPQDGRRCHSKYFVSVSLCHKRGPPPTLSSEIRQGGPARGKRVHTFRGWCAPVRSPAESRVFPETWNARQTRCEKKWAAARDGCKRRPQEILFSLADRGVCFAATFHRRATHQQWARASRSQVSLQPECMRRALQISAESPRLPRSAHSLTSTRLYRLALFLRPTEKKMPQEVVRGTFDRRPGLSPSQEVIRGPFDRRPGPSPTACAVPRIGDGYRKLSLSRAELIF